MSAQTGHTQTKYALLSVSNRDGLQELAAGLLQRGFTLLSTSGTGKFLSECGLPTTALEDFINQKEILGGRVKTLHPKIFAGILARRDHAGDMQQMHSDGLPLIDVVAVNLYPFSKQLDAGHDLAQMIELIDIGGPSLIRAAAKNYRFVYALIDPCDYGAALQALDAGDGSLEQQLEFRKRMACKVFAELAVNNIDIARYLSAHSCDAPGQRFAAFPEITGLVLSKLQDLRYGENPHQRAAFYTPYSEQTCQWRQLWGKELSYNNLLDFDAMARLLVSLPQDQPSAAIIKHLNPCGLARAPSLLEALQQAKLCDPRSHFGGILGFTRTVDADTAAAVREDFAELVVAPGYDQDALRILQSSKMLRVLELELSSPAHRLEARVALNGYLLQEGDWTTSGLEQARIASKRAPSKREMSDLQLAWSICPHIRSNAIALVKDNLLIGVGAGQMSRIDSVELALSKARLHKHDLQGAVAASDAFFPFTDALQTLGQAGVSAVIAPGGAKRDQEIINCADELGLALLFALDRHFRH